ncbi:MAG TPA: energy transducer TonB [Lacunisphaera sp.]
MNTRRLFVTLAALSLGFGLSLSAEEKPAPAKPDTGYTVTLEMKISPAGTVDDAKVISSEDKSVDHALENMAFEAAKQLKLPPRLKDGKAVGYTAREPFLFGVEDDEGPASDNAPKPSIHSAVRPIYPPDLAAKGEVGGVIFEIVFGADGSIKSLKTLRSSNPEFEAAATTAVKQWVFTPAKNKDGVPVESRWRMALSFETDVLRADWKWRFPPRPSLGNYAIVHPTLPPAPPAATGKTTEPAKQPEAAKPDDKPVAK